MRMKLFVITIVTVLAMLSCANEPSQAVVDSQVKKLIDNGWVKMVDKAYVITKSEAEAVDFGVTKEAYRQLRKLVEDSNVMINKVLESVDKDTEITVTDQTYLK